MKQRILNAIGVGLIVLGLFFGYPYITAHWQGKDLVTTSPGVVFADQPVQASEEPLVMGRASRLVIESLGIDLTVAEGKYYATSKTWQLSEDKAHFAELSVENNNKTGNTLIYGHNNKQVFGKLNQIKVGDRAVVYTDNGKRFVYEFRTAVETNPYDDSVFNYKGPAMLTLQTCSGLWYQNRQMFAFDLVEAR